MPRRAGDKPPVTPGEILVSEFLEPLEITQAKFAATIGVSPSYITEIVKGRRGVSAEMALRFERALSMPADFWIAAQSATDLYRAQENRKEAMKRAKIETLYSPPAA